MVLMAKKRRERERGGEGWKREKRRRKKRLTKCDPSSTDYWTSYIEVLMLPSRLNISGTSLVAQWLRICLPMQGT